MKKNFTTLLLIIAFVQLSAQKNFQDFLELDRIVRLQDNELTYRYPRGLITSSFENEVVLLSPTPAEENKKRKTITGQYINLESGNTYNFSLSIPSIYFPEYFHEIVYCDLSENYLMISLGNTQLIYERVKNSFNFIKPLYNRKINYISYLEKDSIVLASTGQFERSMPVKGQFSIGSINDEIDLDKHPVEIIGKNYLLTSPSQFLSSNNNWVSWIEPTTHDLTFYNINNQNLTKKLYYDEEWVEIEAATFKEIQNVKDLGLLPPLVNANDPKISRVWHLFFINEETLITIIHHPNNKLYAKYINVLKYDNEQNDWLYQHKNIKLENWNSKDFDKEMKLTKENFPVRFNSYGNHFIFTKDYLCILTEENSQDFKGKTYREYFMNGMSDEEYKEAFISGFSSGKGRDKTYGLSLHLFKLNLAD